MHNGSRLTCHDGVDGVMANGDDMHDRYPLPGENHWENKCRELETQLAEAQRNENRARDNAEDLYEENCTFEKQLAEARKVVAAVRMEHGPGSQCARQPRPNEGFVGACNLCARLAAFDALHWPD